MIPAGRPGARVNPWQPHDATPAASCTSSRVTWGGGDCLDDAGELVRSCPRHAPATYAQLDARHRADDLPALVAGWSQRAGVQLTWWQQRVLAGLLGGRQSAVH